MSFKIKYINPLPTIEDLTNIINEATKEVSPEEKREIIRFCCIATANNFAIREIIDYRKGKEL
jgi:hypothetical protein